jgi:RNA polymerase sigma-54 factor
MQTLSQHQQLLQKLTPQQVQYLKLLQLPVLALEQRIKEELEVNPLLEEEEEMEPQQEREKEEVAAVASDASAVADDPNATKDGDGYTFEDYMNDDLSGYKTGYMNRVDEDRDDMPLPADIPLSQRIIDQLRLLNLSPDEELLGEEVIGNIDEDGYLRRDLSLIVQDLSLSSGLSVNPQRAEEILLQIQHLDPPGIGARNLQECLTAQLEMGEFEPRLKDLALRIIREYWNEFSMKHYQELANIMHIDLDHLRIVIELIQKLNPKPGEGEFITQQNYVTPDFIVERDRADFIIMLNDKNVPPLRINRTYKEMMSKRRNNGASAETKDFIRKQFERAKWFVASIYQRRETMMKVMRSIVERQRDFFETGENLKPMIYKDIAETIGMDISTISRVVNGKYVQTEYGVFELRHFFSDSIRTTSGEEISNKEVKKKIRGIIETEEPNHPLNDDRIAERLRQEGLNIARRTVAKYRESMNIPIARLRRKL